MITLWGRPSSVNVQKVLWTLAELELPFEHIDAGGDAGGLDDASFRAMNPHGRIPVLKDGEAALWESNTIIRYLCATYAPGGLCPITADRTLEAQRDATNNLECAAAAKSGVGVLDNWLAKRPFVAGDGFSMADIPVGTLMHRYFGMGYPVAEAPHVAAWRGRLAERNGYRLHVMRPFGDLFGRLAY
jgi:glutathione S-transferase